MGVVNGIRGGLVLEKWAGVSMECAGVSEGLMEYAKSDLLGGFGEVGFEWEFGKGD